VFLAAVALSFAAAAQSQQVTLEQAITVALQRNPDLQKQVLLQLSSEQDKIISRSAILPHVDFNGSLSRTRQGAGSVVVSSTVTFAQPTVFLNGYNASLTIRQLVFDGGKWWNNLAAADLTLQSNQAQVDEQRLQITYLVEQRFYELVRAQRQLLVLADAARRSRDQADFTQRLFEGGRSTQADVYAARANRDNDEITRLGQERTVELARADLAVAIGIDPSEPLNIAEPEHMKDEPATPPQMKDAVEQALTRRPSLKAFALTAESNRKAASAAKGDYWPQVSLAAQYLRGVTDWGAFTSSPELNSQLSGAVNLSWNLFAGFNTKANVDKAEVQVKIAENDLESGRRNVAADVEKAVAQLAAAKAQARVAQQGLGTAQEGLRLAKTRQEVGVGTQLEVRDAELKLTQAQLSVVGSLVDGREAEAALRRAQGG
jgi:outer membrane protein TolC